MRSLTLGGSLISREVLRLCVDILGCEKVCTAYVAAEGVMMETEDRDISELVGGSGANESEGVAVAWGVRFGEFIKVSRAGSTNSVYA